MIQRWNAQQDSLEIFEMPFYWRLSISNDDAIAIPSRLGIRVSCREEYDYLEYRPTTKEWQAINDAYRQNANIGFVNPESGQINTYGSSVNQFFLNVVNTCKPQKIYEIGCGAGFSIQYLKEHGWNVTGIDPSEYSLEWSKRLGFALENAFFDGDLLFEEAGLIYCNDVFEHVPNVDQFSRDVYKSLAQGGVFCFSTTNSTQSIAMGDVSMLEHQHVNMFTERSIYLLLADAGFSEVIVNRGSYGNTFQVIAFKNQSRKTKVEIPPVTCSNFFERAQNKLSAFAEFYEAVGESCRYYVPLRCIPYLASVGNYGENDIFDSNSSWHGKYIDGYSRAIKSLSDIVYTQGGSFFIGSLTFYEEIKRTVMEKGYPEQNIFGVHNIKVRE